MYPRPQPNPSTAERTPGPKSNSRLRGSWAPIDTGLFRDRRVRLLSLTAKLLLVACNLRSNESMSDGSLTKSDLRLAAAEVDLESKEETRAVADLLRAGFLQPVGIDYKLDDFRGVSRVERERRQEQGRDRKQRQRERDATRDGERDKLRDERDESVTVTRDSLPAEERDKSKENRETEGRETTSRPAPPVREDVEHLCLHMADSVERRGAKRPTVTAGWRTSGRLMLDQDHRPLEEAMALIDWVERDSFWASNVLSIPTLREKFDRLALKARRTNGSTRPAADLSKYDVHEAAQAARNGQ